MSQAFILSNVYLLNGMACEIWYYLKFLRAGGGDGVWVNICNGLKRDFFDMRKYESNEYWTREHFDMKWIFLNGDIWWEN